MVPWRPPDGSFYPGHPGWSTGISRLEEAGFALIRTRAHRLPLISGKTPAYRALRGDVDARQVAAAASSKTVTTERTQRQSLQQYDRIRRENRCNRTAITRLIDGLESAVRRRHVICDRRRNGHDADISDTVPRIDAAKAASSTSRLVGGGVEDQGCDADPATYVSGLSRRHRGLRRSNRYRLADFIFTGARKRIVTPGESRRGCLRPADLRLVAFSGIAGQEAEGCHQGYGRSDHARDRGLGPTPSSTPPEACFWRRYPGAQVDSPFDGTVEVLS